MDFQRLTQKQAEEIAYEWHYDGDYAFYDMEEDEEDLAEFIDPVQRGNHVFAVVKNKEMIGFFAFHKKPDAIVDIGLGMRPDLTGKGSGTDFVHAGLDFAIERFNPEKITLSVAGFNRRAINVYKKVGFESAGTFMQDTNGGTYAFLKMIYHCA
ncbi:GNAT family N-acetyltransferase [Lentibacillus salicampi]|uniref:N-acetyltransferase n=1 Tax=Lentibacillus salicampi TaxID=175306 RepID=A0A4Y9A7G6_9BACI|nr:GNAT family protein [Lentibacillus salicampi]TFJ91395.1 N-acetyltransferase [Lentibacillus salicampi]